MPEWSGLIGPLKRVRWSEERGAGPLRRTVGLTLGTEHLDHRALVSWIDDFFCFNQLSFAESCDRPMNSTFTHPKRSADLGGQVEFFAFQELENLFVSFLIVPFLLFGALGYGSFQSGLQSLD